jgi:putative peptide zinc metalloprotease protein
MNDASVADTSVAVAVAVTESTRVRLHALSMRPDGDSWVIGRVETGEFISVPRVGQRAVTLLAENRTLAEVGRLLRDETGSDVDIAGFVTSLADLGFLAAVDGRPLSQPAPPRPSLPWLTARHVRWLLRPATAVAAGVLIVAAIAAMAADPTLVPRYRDLLWSGHGSAVIVVNAAVAWTIIFVHELSHLATARAVGVPAWMSLSTRLQFLAAQTDVSGVWAQPRRVRLTVYLAGMTLNLVVSAIGTLILALAEPAGVTYRLIAAVVLISLLFIPTQLLIFMRTDVYFVVQDLTGCANLYADGSAYLRYHAKRRWHRLRRAPETAVDPSRELSVRQRRAVRVYGVILAAGTAGCLAVAATVTIPVALALLGGAAHDVITPASAAGFLDGAAVFLVIGGFQLLWARTWWRRHGHRVHRVIRVRRVIRRLPGHRTRERR